METLKDLIKAMGLATVVLASPLVIIYDIARSKGGY